LAGRDLTDDRRRRAPSDLFSGKLFFPTHSIRGCSRLVRIDIDNPVPTSVSYSDGESNESVRRNFLDSHSVLFSSRRVSGGAMLVTTGNRAEGVDFTDHTHRLISPYVNFVDVFTV